MINALTETGSKNVQFNSYEYFTPVGVLCRKRGKGLSPLTATVCKSNQSEIYYPRIFSQTSCYFVVRNSAKEANRKIGSEYFFNITKARKICSRYNATLPIIASYAENYWLANKLTAGFGLSYKAALGLQQVNYF